VLRRLRPAALLLVAAVTGCAGAGFNNQAFQADVLQGHYDAALERLGDFKDQDVSALLDRGLLLQAAGRYQESNAAFDVAEHQIEDLYTRSLSKEALSLLSGDLALDYRASGYEHAYIAYYRAWNYLRLDMPDEVLVEARRINERLTFRSASCEDEKGVCGHDVFLRYFSGLLFERAGEVNDAYVAYKQADLARTSCRERYGTEAPGDLGVRLVRLARKLGFRDEAQEYAEAYGLDPAVEGPSQSVVVLWENGIIGHRESADALIPIYKGETEKIADDQESWARTLARRRAAPRRKDVDLDYLMRISLPAFVDRPPVARTATFRLGPDEETSTRDAARLSAMAAGALDETMGGIVVRAVARGVVKYLAKRAADKNIGEGAGLLVNLLGVALENADTRSWRSLPNEIQVASLAVEPGTYQGRLEVYNAAGRPLGQADYPDIVVPRNGIAFVRHRSGP